MIDLKSTDKTDTDVAYLFAAPSSPDEILRATLPGLQERLHHLTAKYHRVLDQLGLLSHLNSPSTRESAPVLFGMIHSSFEYALHLLDQNNGLDAIFPHLMEQTNVMMARSKQALGRLPGGGAGYRIYEIMEGDSVNGFFPSPRVHRLLDPGVEDLPFRNLIEAAKEWIGRWNPDLVDEIDFFIRDYALTYGEFSKSPYVSLDVQPGHIKLAPRCLFMQEGRNYERGSEIEVVLVAAQLIHESRHQKGFYFNRVTDPRPLLCPSGFIKPNLHERPLAWPFTRDHVWRELFDMMLALGYELSFLNFLRENFSFGDYEEAFEKKFRKKRLYFHSQLIEAEQNRDAFTPLGLATLEELLHYLESV